MDKIVIGTRGSKLAMYQAHYVESTLKKAHPDLTIEIKEIKTKGDKILDVALAKIGDKGLFVKELENELLDGSVDIAVHSMKDLPTELTKGLVLGAVSDREDVRDAFVSNDYDSLDQLPKGAIVGTSSLRRRAQLLAHRPDLDIRDLRGNVDTRLRKLDEGQYQGIILASAGLKRLGFGDRIKEYLEPEVSLPAVGQGAVGIEMREGDEKTFKIIQCFDNPTVRASVIAERAFLRVLEGGCQIPIGSLAEEKNGKLTVCGIVASLNGEKIIRKSLTGDIADANALGEELAREALKDGAKDILDQVRAMN